MCRVLKSIQKSQTDAFGLNAHHFHAQLRRFLGQPLHLPHNHRSDRWHLLWLQSNENPTIGNVSGFRFQIAQSFVANFDATHEGCAHVLAFITHRLSRSLSLYAVRRWATIYVSATSARSTF